jgi:ethanolamine utilization microcompartment shell protein EutS
MVGLPSNIANITKADQFIFFGVEVGFIDDFQKSIVLAMDVTYYESSHFISPHCFLF